MSTAFLQPVCLRKRSLPGAFPKATGPAPADGTNLSAQICWRRELLLAQGDPNEPANPSLLRSAAYGTTQEPSACRQSNQTKLAVHCLGMRTVAKRSPRAYRLRLLSFAVVHKSLFHKNIFFLRLRILELRSLDKNVYKSCAPPLLRAGSRLPGRDCSSVPTPWSCELSSSLH